jgi:hypothetical protein
MKQLVFRLMLAVVMMFGATQSFAFGTGLKSLLLDNEDLGGVVSGTGWSNKTFLNGTSGSAPAMIGPPNGEGSRYSLTAASETGYFQWDFFDKFGAIDAGPGGSYNLSAYVINDGDSTASLVTYRIYRAPFNVSPAACGTYSLVTSYTFDQNASEGRWGNVGTFSLPSGLSCVRVQLSNQSSSTGDYVWADALNLVRTFESRSTIPDMPRIVDNSTVGNVFVTAPPNAATPTTLTSLTFTCPASGSVLITGSGEATIVSGLSGTGFAGLYFSLVSGSTQFDASAAWQMSSKFDFNGDAARQMVNAQKRFSCSAGTSVQYRLVATLRDNASASSNVFNPTLTSVYTP